MFRSEIGILRVARQAYNSVFSLPRNLPFPVYTITVIFIYRLQVWGKKIHLPYQRNECTYKLVFHLSSLNIGFVHYTTLSSCTCVTEYLHYVVLASCLVRKNEFFKKCIHTYSAVALLGLARIEAKGGKMRDTE